MVIMQILDKRSYVYECYRAFEFCKYRESGGENSFRVNFVRNEESGSRLFYKIHKYDCSIIGEFNV